MHEKPRYNEPFLEAFNRLNQEQKNAVEKIEGPVLVIAGPGTGKTQILAARIGKILLDTDTEPHHILCLTFTDAGVVAMRKRLFSFIGPDAYRVNIHTFHSFCNDIIQENPMYFGKHNMDAISDLERIELFRELIDSLPKGHVLKRYRGDVYYEIKGLQQLFSTMKRENWSAELITEKTAEYLQEIRDAEEGTYFDKYHYKRKPKNWQEGDMKKDFYALEERMQTLKAAVAEFPRYQKMMAKAARYDFDDMINWIINAFKKDDDFLGRYQERFLYVLVDEYQDTSGSQNELIRLLMAHWGDEPNLFVVGDDDQSIYRFQGANIENINSFNQRLHDSLYRVMLVKNYRSTQQILDASRALIDNNTERLSFPGLNKNLVSSNEKLQNLDISPEINAYQSQLHEFADVTHQVKALLGQGTAPQEIAVIYKNHDIGEELARYFQLAKIPISAKKKVDVLKTSFGQKLINLLRYLAMETDIAYSGDELLFHIMHYDFYSIAPIDIAKISLAVNKKNFSPKAKTSIRQYINELSSHQQSLFDSDSLAGIKKLSSDLEFWIKESENLTIQGLFEKIIVRGDVLAYILKSEEKTHLMQILSAMFNLLKEESNKHPEMGLAEFIATIDLLDENDIPIEINKVMFNEQGVNFITCHGAKGLEFGHVFLIGCEKNTWEGKRPNNRGYKMPQNLLGSDHDDLPMEELRRLFYVAMTRAKTNLNISYHSFDEKKGKEMEHTLFIAELLEGAGMEINSIAVPEDRLINFFSLNFSEEGRPKLSLIDKGLVDAALQNYTLSVTHLNNYLDCPLKFYFQNLVKVPSGKSESLTFGSAVHHALDVFFKKMKDDNLVFPPVEKLASDFEWYMQRHREAFTKEQFARRMEYGNKILPEYYAKHKDSWNKIVVCEHNFNNIEVEGVPIKGKVDKLEFDGKSVNIVDYKTGKHTNGKKKLLRPSEKNQQGGDYWRQAVFYKILVDSDRKNPWTAISVEFDFVEPDDKKEYQKEKVYVTAEDIATVKTQITDTYAKILNHEFDTGCGKADCEWCKFVKSNFKDLTLIPQEEEEGIGQ